MNAKIRFLTHVSVLLFICSIAALSIDCGRKATLLGTSAASPIIPVSWTVPTWFIDPANTSGNASDANPCTSSATPCATWQEINVHRWGCGGSPRGCPRLRQSTTITWMSGVTDGSDPVIHFPSVEAGALELLTCSPTLVKTYTGGLSIVSKVVGGPGQLLNATFDASATTKMLAINTTHPSHAWTYKSLGANAFSITQPLVGATPPAIINQAEVDTWASGDTVSLNIVPQVDFVAVEPYLTGVTGSTNNAVYVQGCAAFDPGSTNRFEVNQLVRLFDMLFTGGKVLVINGGSNPASRVGCSNCFFGNSFNVAGLTVTNSWLAAGGAINATSVLPGLGLSTIDGDLILNTGLANNASTTTVGKVYLDTGGQIQGSGGSVFLSSSYGTAIIWGTGSANAFVLTNSSHLTYPAGAGAAATAFVQTGALAINGQNKVCLSVPGAATSFGTCNIALTPAALDANLGATLGCLAVGGGGSFCNL